MWQAVDKTARNRNRAAQAKAAPAARGAPTAHMLQPCLDSTPSACESDPGSWRMQIVINVLSEPERSERWWPTTYGCVYN